MNSKTKATPANEPPKRQGFYTAILADRTSCVAEWREYDKKEGKRWWKHVSDDPTKEKTPVALDGVVGWDVASRQAVEAALKRKPTAAEQREAAYASYCSHRDLYDYRPDAPPECRQLQVGDAILYGNIKDCVVEELRDNGCTVIFRYHDLKNVYGKEVDGGIAYSAAHWTSVLSKAGVTATQLSSPSLLDSAFTTRTIEGVLHDYFQRVDVSPDYQRDYVWTAEDKERFLDSLMSGRDIGRLVFVQAERTFRLTVLDGKQRLDCLWNFYTSRLPYRGLYWHQLSGRDRREVTSRTVQVATLENQKFDRIAQLKIFLELNAAGVPQSQEHLAHVQRLLDEELAKKSASAA